MGSSLSCSSSPPTNGSDKKRAASSKSSSDDDSSLHSSPHPPPPAKRKKTTPNRSATSAKQSLTAAANANGSGSSGSTRSLLSPQLIRDVQELEQQLQQKKQQLRRRLVLATITNHKSDATLVALWQELTPAEQQDEEIVYKILSTSGFSAESVFGRNPWCWRDPSALPDKFRDDSRALLAALSNQRGSLPHNFQVPPGPRDNKQVMMALCAKRKELFKQASPTLWDDDDLVRTAGFYSDNIRRVSERLRKDKNTLMYAVTMGCCHVELAEAWFESLNVGDMDVEEQKEIAWAMHRFLSSKRARCTIRLSKFSPQLLDDEDFMLPLVKRNFHELFFCSKRLRSDETFVADAATENVNAYKYAMGAALDGYKSRSRNRDFVLGKIGRGLLYMRNTPEDLQRDRDIIMAFLRSGSLSVLDGELMFPGAMEESMESMRNDAGVRLALIEFTRTNNILFRDLPHAFKSDEDFAKALLRSGYTYIDLVLTETRSLLTDREVMMDALLDPSGEKCVCNDELPDLIGQCTDALLNDEEFILLAYKTAPHSFQHASEHLRSNRDFLDRVLEVAVGTKDFAFLYFLPGTFQVENTDLILKAIRVCDESHDDAYWWLENLNHGVWSNKQIVITCLNKEWNILAHMIAAASPNARCPLLDDEEVMFLATKVDPRNLTHASPTLRNNRDFILSLIQEIDDVLLYAPTAMKYDKEILLASVARNSGTIADCFKSYKLGDNDFTFLVEFSSWVRSSIPAHHAFKELLLCMHRPSCSVSALNVGRAFKKKIAEYCDIHFPMGPRYELLNAALVNIEEAGF